MTYDFSKFKKDVTGVEEWLANEYLNIRTGRATPALLDPVTVDSYGAKSKVTHVAAISVEDPKTLRVTPWDKTVLKPLESAIQGANLGVSVITDGTGIRVIFPELTGERRAAFGKLVREKLEHARISLKQERESCWNDIIQKEKDGVLSEDERFKLKDDLQKLVDQAQDKFEELAVRKEKDLEA